MLCAAAHFTYQCTCILSRITVRTYFMVNVKNMDSEIFTFEYKDIKLLADVMPAGKKPRLLVLHGSGASNRKRYNYLRELLATRGIASVAFDFVGHGETGGELKESSLHDQTKQAQAVIKKLNLDEINILGSSMGAYNAIKLTELFPVKSLILSVPAVYDKDAYDLKFDSSFTDVIRRRVNTDAWDILSNFKGNLLIYYSGKDEVVPAEITEKIYSSAVQANKDIIKFPDADHKINPYLQAHPEDLEKVVSKIIEFVK